MPSYTEVERKYDVSADTLSPPLHELDGVVRVAQPEVHELDATYFDTADLALARARITLRRRTGGDDAGWHLKLPRQGDDRVEVREPLGPELDPVPAALVDRVRGQVSDRSLIPVARIRTRRTLRRLLGEGDEKLAEFCDDDVTAERLHPDRETLTWREWELELVTADGGLLDAAEQLILGAGARPAEGPSKLARVLGTSTDVEEGRADIGSDPSAGDVFLAYATAMVERLRQHDALVREDADDAVHQMRVACRRLRSVLATYRPILHRQRTDPIRDELKWLGAEMSLARDSEVMRERMGALLADQPAELVLGGVQARLDRHLDGRQREGREHALAALDDARYFAVLDALTTLLAEPPFTEAAQTPAETLLPDLLHRDAKRLRRRVRAAAEVTEDSTRDKALHEVRKAAKRLRYAAESAAPALGARAEELAGVAEAIQDTLGEHQDTAVAREVLLKVGVDAYLAGENAFSFGRLHALEEARAVELRSVYEAQLEKLPTAKIKAWVRKG